MSSAIIVDNLSKVFAVDRAGPAGTSGRHIRRAADLIRAPLHRLLHGASHGLHTEEFWALRDVSFEVKEGEVVGLIGRNGAGKSTLLKILARITGPTSGKAVINGRVASLLEVGTGFHEDLTGRENIYLNGAVLGMARHEIQRHFDAIVDFAGVETFIDTPVKRYSSGMRVRLGFAVAAHLQPEILIVDEVLAVGDIEFQRRCLNKMDDVAQSGRTVLFVSHNMRSIQQLTQRCLLLDGGRLVEDGDADHVVERYFRLNAPADEGEITKEMHSVMNGLRFTQASLCDSAGQPTTTALNFQPVRLYGEFELERQIRELVVTVGVNAMDGTPLARLSSPPDLFGDPPFAPGRYHFEMEFELPVRPGSYQLLLRADRGLRRHSELAGVANAIFFELLESRDLGVDAANRPFAEPMLPLLAEWRRGEPITESEVKTNSSMATMLERQNA